MKTIVFNKKGMTLAETIIGVAVLSISLVIIVSTQLSIKNEMNKLDTKIQGKIEVLGGEKLILFDIQAASLSFNNINIADNNSKNFFDYLPEKSAGLVSNNPDRILTLAVGRKTEIIFLLQDTKKGSVLIYDPVAAYNIGAASDNFNVAATLTFSSLNKGNFVSNQRAQFWNNGQILFLDTMARIRTPAAAVDMNIPPRSALGRPVLLIPESGRDADFAPPMEQRGGSRSQQPRKPTREEYEAQVAARRAIRRGYGAPEGT